MFEYINMYKLTQGHTHNSKVNFQLYTYILHIHTQTQTHTIYNIYIYIYLSFVYERISKGKLYTMTHDELLVKLVVI